MILHLNTRRSLQSRRSQVAILALFVASVPGTACAGISTDTSLGHPAQTLTGPNYLIPQSLGLLSGSNLFQSFLSFSLNSGESANFTTSTSGIANVISRVTGGSLSQINGQISLTPCNGCGSPNFVFINPAGITFGAGASINVPGAFHVSTADYVKFSDGNFYADLSKVSTLSVAAPESFGFLGTSRAAITINGGATLQTQPGQPISLVAGDVTLDNGVVSTMNGGDIRVAAVGQAAQEIGLTGPMPATNGNLNILQGGNINADTATTATAGSVTVSAGNISIDGNASINSNGISTLGISSTTSTPGNNGNAGNVNVMASGNISLANGGVISGDTYSAGSAGSVTVTAAGVTIDGSLASGSSAVYYSSRISSQTNGDSTGYFGSSGNAGAVTVNATGAISIKNSGAIDADSNTSGNAGPVTINAGSITVDAQGNPGFKGILSDANSSTGNAGNILITSASNLSVVNGGNIAADTAGSGNAGNITIHAASVTVDGQANSNVYTGIWSEADGGTGAAGNISLTSSGGLSLVNGAEISASTYTNANAGSIGVSAGSVSISGGGVFTGIVSDTYAGAGNAGAVNITTPGNLSISNGGRISSSTTSTGNAGVITINAGSVSIDGQGNAGAFTGIGSNADSVTGNTGSLSVTGNASTISVTATGNVSVVNGGLITAGTQTTGSAGSIYVNAGSVNIDGQNYSGITGISSDQTYGTGAGGSINVAVAGNIAIVNGAEISASTFASGNAGTATVSAGSITIDGQGNTGVLTGIFSNAFSGSTGKAGVLNVSTSGNLSVVDGGQISSSTEASGNAGTTKINAGSIAIDGQGNNSVSTGFFSDAFAGSTGNAGSIGVTTAGILSIINGGDITTTTSSSGNAGSITISAESIGINGQGYNSVTGISSDALPGSSGNAGSIRINTTGNMSMINGSSISSNTYSSGNAGAIKVNSGSITIDGQGNNGVPTGIFSDAAPGSTGTAGSISVTSTGDLSIVNGSSISSSTLASGNGGTIIVNAGAINIDAEGNSVGATGIFGDAFAGTGNAGTLNITSSGNLSIANGGIISTSTSSSGKAGSIAIDSGTLSVDGLGSAIKAAALAGSSGQTGTVAVTASNAISLSDSGQISIANNATVAAPSALTPTSISVTAPTINIVDSPIAITAWSTGNVDAGSIKITSGHGLFLTNSGIYTTAVNGNGGSIAINAGLINLDSSQITSVSNFGVGGNINIMANALVMNTGYILAYAPTSLIGGDIAIDVPNLIASGNTLFVGHANILFQPDVFGLNVIQATGTVQTSSPALDIAGSLIGLNTKVIDSGGLGRNPCQITGGSSLSLTGQGGLAPSSRGLLRAELPVSPSDVGSVSSDSDTALRLAVSDWGCN